MDWYQNSLHFLRKSQVLPNNPSCNHTYQIPGLANLNVSFVRQDLRPETWLHFRFMNVILKVLRIRDFFLHDSRQDWFKKPQFLISRVFFFVRSLIQRRKIRQASVVQRKSTNRDVRVGFKFNTEFGRQPRIQSSSQKIFKVNGLEIRNWMCFLWA